MRGRYATSKLHFSQHDWLVSPNENHLSCLNILGFAVKGCILE
jgi:hypothetical protein